MTGHEIVKAAEVYIGKSIELDVALTAINEAIRKIADMGLVYDTVNINVTQADQWVKLPNDLTNVLRVYNMNGRPYDGWEVMGGKIKFSDCGSYTVHLRRIPARLTDLSEEPDINEGYHNSIVRYVREFAMKTMSSDFAYKTPNFDGFEIEVLKTYSYLNKRRQPRQVKVIRHA